jgi:hypothetical protein
MNHFSRKALLLLALPLCTLTSSSQLTDPQRTILGNAFTSSRGYDVLERLCDEAGGRLAGTEANRRGMDILIEELTRDGFTPRRQPFTGPGWQRGDDELIVQAPFHRRLRAAALGYTNACPTINDTLLFAGHGTRTEYNGLHAAHRIVLVESDHSPLLRYEAIDTAAAQGARAVLFINDRPGGLLLAGVCNFQGTPSPIPAYSITFEEGNRLRRLAQRGIPVVMSITTRSACVQTTSDNLVLSFPGEQREKIVIGAHFDSWDLGQGSVDNGLGTAILVDIARLLKNAAQRTRYSVELVWFNGEELGLLGSNYYARTTPPESIAAMINLDMTGAPRSMNAMGFEALVPVLSSVAKHLEGIDLSNGIASVPGTNSDFQAFMLEGIPSVSIDGYLEPENVRYYHDFSDTFDKVVRRDLSSAAAVTAVVGLELANAPASLLRHKTRKEVVEVLKKYNVDQRLKRQREWRFGD